MAEHNIIILNIKKKIFFSNVYSKYSFVNGITLSQL